MSEFISDGVGIAYLDQGQGEPVLLIHGFASSKDVNWVYTGWVDLLVKSGRRVIAIDNRGHGESEKLYDTAQYGAPIMAEDARRLLDHLNIERADVMGYSMGTRISAFLTMAHPSRVRRAIFGGLGYGMIKGVGASEPIAEALEAPSLDDVSDPTGRAFRKFADQTKSDRMALATCIRSARQKIRAQDVARITQPVMVAVGTRDDIAGSATDLASLIPKGRALDIPDRDHMLAVGDKVYKQGVVDFLAEELSDVLS